MLHVVSLGGSIMVPDTVDSTYVRKFVLLIKSLVKKGEKFIIVTGGGAVCRSYFSALDKTHDKGRKGDTYSWLGIAITGVHAQFLLSALTYHGINVYPSVIPSLKTKINFKKYDVAVGCGYEPGHSTDFDAVSFGVVHSAQTVYNLTNVSHIYDKDPRKYKSAKPFETLTWKDFFSLSGLDTFTDGKNVPFDAKASRLAKRKKMQVVICDGTDISNLRKVFLGSGKKTIIS